MNHPQTSTLVYVVNNPAFFISHRLPLAKRAREMGFKVVVFAPPSDLSATIKSEGFDVEDIYLNRKSLNPIIEIKTLIDLHQKLKKWQPQIVHGISSKPIIYSALAGYFLPVPFWFHTITGLGYAFTKGGVAGLFLRKVVSALYRLAFFKKNVKVVFQNFDDFHLFVRCGIVSANKSVVIRGSGVNLNRFVPSDEPAGDPVILFPSRIVKDKGIYELIEAAKILNQEGVRFRLLLAGIVDTGSRAAISEANVLDWEKTGFIQWLGPRDDMPEVYKKSHIVCLPSYREGLSLSLLEAAACARPIVTTDVPGCRDVIIEGETGFAVPLYNVNALKEALRKLIESPDLRKKMGKKSRQYIQSFFSVEAVVKETTSLYEKVLPAKKVAV